MSVGYWYLKCLVMFKSLYRKVNVPHKVYWSRSHNIYHFAHKQCMHLIEPCIYTFSLLHTWVNICFFFLVLYFCSKVLIDTGFFLLHFISTGTESTPLQVLTLLVSLGYFMFDMGWCIFFRTEGPLMLAHHTLSILGMLMTLGLGESGSETCAVLFGSEITNPLLQARWFLKRAGQYDSLAGDAVDLLFILLFGIVRIGVGSAMLEAVLTSTRTRPIVKAEGVAFYTLSWIFMVDIARFACRKSCKKYRGWQERRKQESVNGKAHQH